MAEEKARGSKIVKKRHWAFIVYPDSAPPDWIERLQQTGLPCAISPLHDKDINPDHETEKKPHYHVMATWQGPTAFSVAKGIADNLNGPMPKPIESMKGSYRYLTHMDNPEKHQYDAKDIKLLNGFNITDFSEMTKSEVDAIKRQLLVYIRENDIIDYDELMYNLYDSGMLQELDIASCNTIHFGKLLSARRFRKNLVYIDRKTGEVVEVKGGGY